MIRGWCPSLYDPMATGDGLLVRVKPRAARLTSAGLCALADAAARFGNGVVELTRRGNLQVRGLSPDGVAGFAAAMVAAGLADPDPTVERRRIVIPPPLAGDDPDVSADAMTLADAIEARVPPGLPPKFCIAIDGGGILAGAPAADIVVRVPPGEAVDGAMQAAVGRPRAKVQPARPPATAVGFIPYPDDHGAFGMGLPFGQTDPAGLRLLAALADRFGGGAIRISPWRSVLLGRVAARDLPAIRAMAAALVLDPADPRLRVSSCIGSPCCGSATVPARMDAVRLAALGATAIHVSGCAKGCAHPGGAALVGDNGRYSRVENWRAGTAPEPQGLTLEQAAA